MGLAIHFNLPNQPKQHVVLDTRILIGTLLSNDIVIRVAGVDPIHGMLEKDEKGSFFLTDLGSKSGIDLNGHKVDVEQEVRVGDVFTIGKIQFSLHVIEKSNVKPLEVTTPGVASRVQTKIPTDTKGIDKIEENTNTKVARSRGERKSMVDEMDFSSPRLSSAGEKSGFERRGEEFKNMLFSPRKAKPAGDFLEMISYWGDTIIDVELFHPKMKGFDRITIGDDANCHFISGGKSKLSNHKFASFRQNGYRVSMLNDMKARVRKGGEVVEKKGKNSLSLGKRDIAHISHGALRYFLMFTKPPELNLPKEKSKDPLFVGLMSASMLMYFIAVPFIWMATPQIETEDEDDVWSIVNVPEKKKAIKRDVVKKPKVVAEVKKPPPPKPPPPKPKPVKPVKPIEKPKPKPPQLAKPKPLKRLAPLNNIKVAKAPKPVVVPKSKKGMFSTGSKDPNFKLAGEKDLSKKLGRAGGSRGAGKNQKGGARKGKGKISAKGVRGPKNKKSSGVNLSKLGMGVGKIFNKMGPGAVRTNFKNSAGGAGGGSGSASKTFGLGGVGKGSSLGLSGSSAALNQFGSGSGGFGGGQGGSGGLGGAGIGRGFKSGRGRANVVVPPGDPVVSGGLTSQEVQAVIRANLNQIRHCYEQLLQRSPSSSGKVKVKFRITGAGRVSSASVVSSSIKDPIMKSCVTGKITRWKFPRPRGGQPVTVGYPFVFNPL